MRSIGVHGALSFLRVLAFGAVFVLFVGLLMELMTVLRAKLMHLRSAATPRAIVWLVLAFAVIVGLLLAIAFVPLPRLHR
jgi:hypothetical protein